MHATRTDGGTPDRCITLRAGSCGRRKDETRTVRTFLSVDADSFRRFLGEDGASVVKRERGVVREDRASHRVDREPIETVPSHCIDRESAETAASRCVDREPIETVASHRVDREPAETAASRCVDREPIEIVGSDTLSLVVKRLHPSSTMVHPSVS